MPVLDAALAFDLTFAFDFDHHHRLRPRPAPLPSPSTLTSTLDPALDPALDTFDLNSNLTFSVPRPTRLSLCLALFSLKTCDTQDPALFFSGKMPPPAHLLPTLPPPNALTQHPDPLTRQR
ncbi:hypothetical protein DFH06DRAFT_1342156 [Mycena polygramma]|nr:hypothetical protein DFH06DRAFT_1342156 [Mycena polygramma]